MKVISYHAITQPPIYIFETLKGGYTLSEYQQKLDFCVFDYFNNKKQFILLDNGSDMLYVENNCVKILREDMKSINYVLVVDDNIEDDVILIILTGILKGVNNLKNAIKLLEMNKRYTVIDSYRMSKKTNVARIVKKLEREV